MGNHASSDQGNTMEVTGNSSTTSVPTLGRVSSSVDKAYSNSSGMNNQVLSDQQKTKMAACDLSTMALCTLDGESDDEDDSDYEYESQYYESEDESGDESKFFIGDDECEDLVRDEQVQDNYGSEDEGEDGDESGGDSSFHRSPAENESESANEAADTTATSGDNDFSRAKSKETSVSSFTTGIPSPSPPPCAPSHSQPFPLPSYVPVTPLDPSIDLSLKGDLPEESESSSEPDFPDVSEMLAKTRPPASQPANSTFQKGQGQAQASADLATGSQGDISAGLSKSPMAACNINHPSPVPLPNPPPKPRPLAGKVKSPTTKVISSFSTLDDEAVGRNENNETGKRKAPDESAHSPKTDVSTENLNLDEVRPAKRPRLEEEPLNVPRKHDEFWILDGNTVLEVGGVLFKLHRSRLVDQSGFFASLLDKQDVFMDESVVIETEENGVVYHLLNTTPKDLEALLQLDKNPMAYYFTPPPFPVLAAVLRASTALGFDTYRAFAVKLLENAWSSSLADLTTETKHNAVEVVVLARTCGVESVLKRAFYEMVRMAGYGLSDGELDGDDGEASQEISRADERRLERMREHLISTWSQAAVRVDSSFKCPNEAKTRSVNSGDESSSSTSTDSHCRSLSSKRADWERLVHDSGLYDEYQFDPLCGLQALIDIKWDEEDWCSDCVRARREAWTRMRRRTWERVGVWMGLDG